MLDSTSPAAIAAAINPGFHLKTCEVQDLTMDLVKAYRDMPSTAVERDISKQHVKHLRTKADQGRLVTFHWVTTEVVTRPGITLRVNGQHSSFMLAEMDGFMPPGLKVLREHYICDDDNAVALLFQQFDDRRSSRTPSDIAGVYMGLVEELKTVDKKYGKLAIDGYIWHQRHVEKVPTLVGDEVYAMFKDANMHPYIHWFNSLHNSKTRELQKPAVAAAVFGTYDTNQNDAKEFWEEVARGGNPDEDDAPARALDLWLRQVFEGDLECQGIGAANLYQGCIYCWNAWRDGKKVSSIKYEVKKNFISIRE